MSKLGIQFDRENDSHRIVTPEEANLALKVGKVWCAYNPTWTIREVREYISRKYGETVSLGWIRDHVPHPHDLE